MRRAGSTITHFDISRHVRRAASEDLDQAVEHCMSRQLSRQRPLWEVRIAEQLGDGRIAVIGKAHHCMVDGIAAVELASLLLDPTPDAEPGRRTAGGRTRPQRRSRASSRGLSEKAMGPVRLARGAGRAAALAPAPALRCRGRTGRARCRRPHPSPGDSGGAAEPAALGAAAPGPGRAAARRSEAGQGPLWHQAQRRLSGGERRRRAPAPDRAWPQAGAVEDDGAGQRPRGGRGRRVRQPDLVHVHQSCPATSPTPSGVCAASTWRPPTPRRAAIPA